MTDTVSLSAELSAPTTEDSEVTSLSGGGSVMPPSHARTENLSNTNRRSSSRPWHQKPGPILGKHPLSAVMDAPLFRDLSAFELAEMINAGQERVFSHSESLFGEGDPLRWVSMITCGHAKLIRHSGSGKLMILHIFDRGDVLDGLGSSPRCTHSVEARAMRHCRVFSWDVRRFESLSSRFPTLGRNSMRLLRARSRMLEGRVHELATDRVPQRLAKVLVRLILQAQGSSRRPWTDLTGDDLAQMAGTTQSTVSRLLCDWASRRIIQPERTAILVKNLPGLIAIAMQAD